MTSLLARAQRIVELGKAATPGGKVHELKCWPAPFAAMRSGAKTFEFRKDDRDYAVGDILKVREWQPPASGHETPGFGYTDEVDTYRVTYKLAGRFGVPEGYCVLGIVPAAARDGDQMAAKLIEAERHLARLLRIDDSGECIETGDWAEVRAFLQSLHEEPTP